MANHRPKLVPLAVLLIAGCSQIIGLSDFEVDPNLDVPGEGGDSGSSNGGSNHAGTKNMAGENPGTAGAGEGGNPGGGGVPGMAGAPANAGQGQGGEGGSGDTREVIPCATADCCDTAGGVVVSKEMLDNLGFEDGPSWWGESSSGNYDLIVEESPPDTINAHLGSWFVWLGGATDETAVMLTPAMTVPPQTGWVTFTGYRRHAFDSALGAGDFSQLSVYKENEYDSPIKDLFVWDSALDETSGWEKFTKTEPGTDYLGLSMQLSLLAITDTTADDPVAFEASNFYFDDLSFTANYCVAP